MRGGNYGTGGVYERKAYCFSLFFHFLFFLQIVNGDVNSYNVLGLTSESSNKEIKAAYRKFALLYHPDKVKAMKRKCSKVNNEPILTFEVKLGPRESAKFVVFKGQEIKRVAIDFARKFNLNNKLIPKIISSAEGRLRLNRKADNSKYYRIVSTFN